MWNSNSLIAWLFARCGHLPSLVHLPAHGRAPGWRAGLIVAAVTMACTRGRAGVKDLLGRMGRWRFPLHW